MKLKCKMLLGILGSTCLFVGRASAHKINVDLQNHGKFTVKQTSKVRRFVDSESAANFISSHYIVIKESGNLLEGIRIRGKKLVMVKMEPVGPSKGETKTRFDVKTYTGLRVGK